jgi:glutamine amidotransferase
MQLLATVGREFGDTPGFDWIKGEVTALKPSDKSLKIPHMGWNALTVDRVHPVLDGVSDGDHAYFVHSFHLEPSHHEDRVASVAYGQDVTAAVARDTIFGTQFHPEKSQKTGLQIIGNFLTWAP